LNEKEKRDKIGVLTIDRSIMMTIVTLFSAFSISGIDAMFSWTI
jgi:hypothetical protein